MSDESGVFFCARDACVCVKKTHVSSPDFHTVPNLVIRHSSMGFTASSLHFMMSEGILTLPFSVQWALVSGSVINVIFDVHQQNYMCLHKYTLSLNGMV